MRIINLITLIVLTLSGAVAAAEAPNSRSYLCSHPQISQKRVVELSYLATDQAVPCEVRYSKGEETTVLWQARAESGYCESKLDAFLAKQAQWGWRCEQIQ